MSAHKGHVNLSLGETQPEIIGFFIIPDPSWLAKPSLKNTVFRHIILGTKSCSGKHVAGFFSGFFPSLHTAPPCFAFPAVSGHKLIWNEIFMQKAFGNIHCSSLNKITLEILHCSEGDLKPFSLSVTIAAQM